MKKFATGEAFYQNYQVVALLDLHDFIVCD